MKSGDPTINRNDDYFRLRFVEITDKHFTSHIFHRYPALVSKIPVNGQRMWEPYYGGEYNKEQFEIVEGCGTTSIVRFVILKSKKITPIGQMQGKCAFFAMNVTFFSTKHPSP